MDISIILMLALDLFPFPEVPVVLLCLLLQAGEERLVLLLGDGQGQCPDGGGDSEDVSLSHSI